MQDNQLICDKCKTIKELSYDNFIDVTVSYCLVCNKVTRHFKDIEMLKRSEYICQCTKCGKKSVCLMKFSETGFTKYCPQCGEPVEHIFVPKVVTK